MASCLSRLKHRTVLLAKGVQVLAETQAALGSVAWIALIGVSFAAITGLAKSTPVKDVANMMDGAAVVACIGTSAGSSMDHVAGQVAQRFIVPLARHVQGQIGIVAAAGSVVVAAHPIVRRWEGAATQGEPMWNDIRRCPH